MVTLYLRCPAQKITQTRKKTTIEILTPPGGLFLYDNVFIDETEVANIHYLEYLYFIKKDSSENFFIAQLPDSSVWQRLIRKDSFDTSTENYLRYPGFRYFPVIGISYEQAMNFCKWRGDVVTEYYKVNYDKKYPALKNFELIVEYRLPTHDEWEYAAAGSTDILKNPHGITRPFKNRRYNATISNCRCEDCLTYNNIAFNKKDIIHTTEFNVQDDYYFSPSNQSVICPVKKSPGTDHLYNHPPNNFGLFNMIGNVAEMTLEKGIAKGGSFQNKLSDFTIKTDFPYSAPQEWLGFRCVAVVHFRRK